MPSACCGFGSVPGLCCLCGVVDPCWFTASLDDCHSCKCSLPSSSGAGDFWIEWYSVRLVCLSPTWLALVLDLRFPLFAQFLVCAVSMVSLTPDSSHLAWMLAAVVWFWLHHPVSIILGCAGGLSVSSLGCLSTETSACCFVAQLSLCSGFPVSSTPAGCLEFSATC